MKRLIFIAVIAAVAFCAWQFPSWKESQRQLAVAEQRVIDVLEAGTNNLSFDDLHELRSLPSNISEVPNLVYLQVQGTKISDLSILDSAENLQQLNLNNTRVADLSPLEGLPALRLVYLHNTWIKDLSPLVTLPALERVDVGNTQIATLEPLTRMQNLRWLNLHKSHALDGSMAHFGYLQERVPELSGGSAFRQNYQPGWQYNAMLRFARLKAQLNV